MPPRFLYGANAETGVTAFRGRPTGFTNVPKSAVTTRWSGASTLVRPHEAVCLAKFELWRIRRMSFESLSLGRVNRAFSMLSVVLLLTGCGWIARSKTAERLSPEVAVNAEESGEETSQIPPVATDRQEWQPPDEPLVDWPPINLGRVLPASATRGAANPAPTAALRRPVPRQPDRVVNTQQDAQEGRRPQRVEKIDTEDFSALVLQSDIPVIVDFYADWCGPCKRLGPILDEFARETPDVKVVKVDIDDSKKLARKYGVKSVPTVMLFKNGAPVSHHTGLADRAKLAKLLTR